MRVLVCRGRKFDDTDMLDQALRTIHDNVGISCIIHGAAKGADLMGAGWGSKNHIESISAFVALWNEHGKKAGVLRNTQMIKEGHPDIIVAFPGGVGTENMKRQGRQNNIMVVEVSKDDNGTVCFGEF